MDPKDIKTIIHVLVYVSVITGALAIGHWYTERILKRWAESRGYHLAAWRSFTMPWDGPRAGRRFRGQADYRVAVYDPQHDRERYGWVMVDWKFFPIGEPKVLAQWDGCMPEYDGD